VLPDEPYMLLECPRITKGPLRLLLLRFMARLR
jgi:hypothetical protein